MKYFIDIETTAGEKKGAGPLLPTKWSFTSRLSRAGSFSFTYPALDARKKEVLTHRIAHCQSVDRTRGVNDFGSGVIEKNVLSIPTKNSLTITTTGGDLLRELQFRTVSRLVIDDGNEGEVHTGITDIMEFAPSGWSIDTVIGYDTTLKAVAHNFDGETVLAALVKLAELTGENFYNDGRKLVWIRKDRHAATVRAVQSAGGISLNTNPDVCIIQSLRRTEDAAESQIGRTYAVSGNTDGISATTKTPPTGWVHGAGAPGMIDYLEHTATWNAYGIEKWKVFSEIEASTLPNEADRLYEAVFEWMSLHLANFYSYTVTITGLQKPLHPGQLIALEYRNFIDGYKAIDINEELLILENKTDINAAGGVINRLTIANIARWPDGSAEIFARNLK